MHMFLCHNYFPFNYLICNNCRNDEAREYSNDNELDEARSHQDFGSSATLETNHQLINQIYQ